VAKKKSANLSVEEKKKLIEPQPQGVKYSKTVRAFELNPIKSVL
jgi:hypothetical protein